MVDADLVLALELADLADGLALARFRELGLAVDTKPDLTPVTEVDRAVEAALRVRLEETRRADAVLGEELGAKPGVSGRRWLLDPIDGTRNYVRGIPVWATLIALEHDGEPVLGVASAPALGRRWWATRGEGAFADGRAIRVSGVARLEDSVVSRSQPTPAATLPSWHARDFGDFWQHVLVAEGAVDVAVEGPLNLWDWAPVQVVVEEAGGRVTALDGGPPREGAPIVSTNGLLHDEVLARYEAAARAASS